MKIREDKLHIFYTPDISPEVYTLSEEESRHCVKVLRLQEGAEVYLVDGRGGFYTANIREADPRHCVLRISSVQQEYGKRPYNLHIAIAPTKNTDRFEWFLEKATEAGIDEITPLVCDRSERRTIRTDRLFRRITSAVKQSIKAYHPVLNEPVGFAGFINRELPGPGGQSTLKCIAHCGDGRRQSLKQLVRPGQDVLALIGPEGDFTREEVDAAMEKGFVPLHLGESRLRTETAGLAVCFELGFLNR